jgi:LysR family transcriptional regulator, hydrogen peroxide-inducible genes activator
MTLTELRYVLALNRERHFGRAAERCFVTQPTLSQGIQKLEDEIGYPLFERNRSEILVTPEGTAFMQQAQRVMDEMTKLIAVARSNKDQLVGPLRLGVIPTVGPYLLPELVPRLKERAPEMSLEIEENLTGNLTPMLRDGLLDCAIIALPYDVPAVSTVPLYDERMAVAINSHHPWAKRKMVAIEELGDENVLMLNIGNCFRDQVLEACPGQINSANEGRAGSSLETIRSMVASGLGVSVMPEGSVQKQHMTKLVKALQLQSPAPTRRIALAHRTSFVRKAALEVLIAAVSDIDSGWVRHVDGQSLKKSA